MSSLFCHISIVNDDDFVGILNSRQSMSYNDARATNLCLVKSILHYLQSNNTKDI